MEDLTGYVDNMIVPEIVFPFAFENESIKKGEIISLPEELVSLHPNVSKIQDAIQSRKYGRKHVRKKYLQVYQ